MTRELVGLFSGGKDSLVACDIAGLKEVVYCRTGVGLNENYVKEICERFDWNLNIVEPAPFEYETFVQRYSFPRPTSHTWIMQRLKLNPIKKWFREQKKLGRDIVFGSGIRIKESKRRKMNFAGDVDYEETLVGELYMRFCKPIKHWSSIDVSNYIKDNKLQISPTYKTLGLGGDCLCGAFTKREHTYILNEHYPKFAERIKELEKNCRGHWGQFQSLTACENQSKIEGFVCNECMVLKD